MRFFKREEVVWKDNPVAEILLYSPAVVITTVLSIPLFILSLPILIFSRKIQRVLMRFLLSVQHTIGLSFWYFAKEYFFPDILTIPLYIEIPVVLLSVYFGFKNSINILVEESIVKFGF
jgi:hypothetical protein